MSVHANENRTKREESYSNTEKNPRTLQNTKQNLNHDIKIILENTGC